jgi:ribosomal protein S18 acetylase RimI-like enzyme
MKITIREAVREDLPVLLKFEQRLIEAERPMDPTIRKGELHYYDIGAFIEDKEVKVLVAEVDGQIVSSGYGIAKSTRPYLDHDQYAHLGFMYTLPEFRGRGINGMIIESLKEWAGQKGLREVRLTVYQENEPAIASYEKSGFQKHLIEMRLRLPTGEKE